MKKKKSIENPTISKDTFVDLFSKVTHVSRQANLNKPKQGLSSVTLPKVIISFKQEPKHFAHHFTLRRSSYHLTCLSKAPLFGRIPRICAYLCIVNHSERCLTPKDSKPSSLVPCYVPFKQLCQESLPKVNLAIPFCFICCFCLHKLWSLHVRSLRTGRSTLVGRSQVFAKVLNCRVLTLFRARSTWTIKLFGQKTLSNRGGVGLARAHRVVGANTSYVNSCWIWRGTTLPSLRRFARFFVLHVALIHSSLPYVHLSSTPSWRLRYDRFCLDCRFAPWSQVPPPHSGFSIKSLEKDLFILP